MSVSLNYGHIIFYSCVNLLFLLIVFRHLKKKGKELQYEKATESSGFMQCEMIGADENTKLVIRSIGSAKHGVKNFGDIVNDTNLSLGIINSALDWLVMNKLATEIDGRKGKAYELSPKCRNDYSFIINPKN